MLCYLEQLQLTLCHLLLDCDYFGFGPPASCSVQLSYQRYPPAAPTQRPSTPDPVF